MNNTSTAFFSSARTSKGLKKQTEEVLSELGLSWSAFVNNAARKLVQEKTVEFSLRDTSGFTSQKSKELQEAIHDTQNKTPQMNLNEAQDFLSSL